MYGNEEFNFCVIDVILNWAILISRVVSCTPLPLVSNKATLLGPEVESLGVDRVGLLKLLEDLASVVISHMLFSSAGRCIVVLRDTDHIHHCILCLHSQICKL